MKRLIGVVLVMGLSAVSLSAHDVWIEPTTFAPALGDIVGVRLRVGQDFVGDPMPRNTALIEQFIVEDAEGRRPVIGRHGSDPAGVLRVAAPGVIVIGYRSHPSLSEQGADKFHQYLHEEGLEAIAALRGRRGQAGPVRELYSRCAKSLLRSDGATGPQGDRRLGCTFELLAERSPYVMEVGQELPVRLTYESRPLAGALVVAINRLHPTEKLNARSDHEGRVRFRLSRTGSWLIKAVHMVEAPPGAGADWVSYWASLTFAM